MKSKIIFICLLMSGLYLHAQPARDLTPGSGGISAGASSAISAAVSAATALPLRRVALFSSGVGYFEHSGPIAGPAEISLLFDADAINDVLASLVLNDPASASPSLRYDSEGGLLRSLRSLRIDLSRNPGIGDILYSQRGQEVEIHTPNPVRGRIIGVEQRSQTFHNPTLPPTTEPWLSILTSQGIRTISIMDIVSFRFIDEGLNADLYRALNILEAFRENESRDLRLSLDGRQNRIVSLSYVIAAPVWKVSYRLDLTGDRPFLQGWAIVDNDSDNDWEGVELSLVSGRPVSFIQQLYPPYRVFRPVLPLAIAGTAEGRAHESDYLSLGFTGQDRGAPAAARAAAPMAMMEMQMDMEQRAAPPPALAGGVVQTAEGRAAGDQFEFTLRSPVNLERRQSAMLPLVEGNVEAQKTLVFSGSRAQRGATIHPEISAELTNTSGMSLPAGPITVYDGGTYAGDALIEFFPENEKRLISFGEDLSVTGTVSQSSSRNVTTVTVSGGVMTINRRQNHERVYTIRNASGETKRLLIEHPITSGAELAQPENADERTASLYRFAQNLSARETLSFTVREETPLSERITLGTIRPEAFLSYSTSQEIPANVRAALTRAIELRQIADAAELAQRNLEAQLTRLASEQERIRRNLEAAGNQSPQGQEYLRRMAALDSEIDGVNANINQATEEVRRTRQEYQDYLASITI